MASLPWVNLIHQGLSQFKASAANSCNSAMLLEGSTETSFSSPIRLMRRISKGSPEASSLVQDSQEEQYIYIYIYTGLRDPFQLHFGLRVHIFHPFRNLAFCSRPGSRETSVHLYGKQIGKRQSEGWQRFEQLNKLRGRDTWEGGFSGCDQKVGTRANAEEMLKDPPGDPCAPGYTSYLGLSLI